MNDRKLNQLLRAARKETPCSPAPGFENLVLAALRQPGVTSTTGDVPLFDQLGAWFPRLAAAAALLIVLCVAADFGLAAYAAADLTDSLTELSEQWLFAAN
jgi:hypothetical protein